MGFIKDEKTFINNQIFKYEDRLNSQYTKFLEKPPTYVTYYNINNITSTTDNGFGNVESILGRNSPLKFKEIKDFPIYDIESLILDLSEEDEGLTTSLESEAIILPNTIKPMPNDYFTISYLKDAFLFIVTDVKYDTIKSNNYYKISFSVKSLSKESIDKLNHQVDEKFTCISSNIGTQDKCLLEDDQLKSINKLKSTIVKITNEYITLFYNKKYNSFLYNTHTGVKLYNRYATHFFNKEGLINNKNEFVTLMLSIEDNTSDFNFMYDMSIYKALNSRKIRKINNFSYDYKDLLSQSSIFMHYNDKSIRTLSLNMYGQYNLLSNELVEKIKTNDRIFIEDGLAKIPSLLTNTFDSLKSLNPEIYNHSFANMIIFASLIIDYMNDNIKSISTIDLDLIEDEFIVDPSYMSFLYVPIVIYILNHYYSQYMRN